MKSERDLDIKEPPAPLHAPPLLLDEATPQEESLVADVKAQTRVAADVSRSVVERVEAYEDIIDSQIGDTTLSRARNLEREWGLHQIYVKFEGGNPTGTQKDRIAFAQVIDAVRRGYDCVTVATCGNFGAALSLAAKLAGLRCVLFIPKNYDVKRLAEMHEHGALIERVDGDYETAVRWSRERAEAQELYDANPGGANSALQLSAYGEIAREIYDELRDAPAAVAVPVSNGTTMAGIHRGFLSLYRRGKTSRMPRMVAGSSFGKNPIVRSFRSNLDSCSDLPPERIRETQINEPLINWHSIDGQYALDAIRQTKGWAYDVSDRNMMSYSKLIREREGLNVLPASTAGLVALVEGQKRQPLPSDRYVAILTGKK